MVLKNVVCLLMLCWHWKENAATKISGADDLPTGLWNLTATDNLRRALLPGYDRWVRPAGDDEITPVKFSLRVRHIHIDETKSTATLVGWIKIVWHDNKLRWNSSDYKNIDAIRISSDEIWKPDLELYNPAIKAPNIGTQANILLYADGTVLWVPPVRFDVFCKLNLKDWPRDTQTCRFMIGSWTHHALAINLTFDNGGYDSEALPWDEDVGRWKIGEVLTERLIQHYSCCAEPYISLQYDITVERQSGAQVFINEAPIIALIIILVAAALKEPASRGILLVTVAIISSLYLISLTVQLPSLTERPPKVALFYCGLLSLAALWGLSSAAVDRISRGKRPVPGALRRFVKKSKLNIAAEEDGVTVTADSEKSVVSIAGGNWCRIAVLLDRILLVTGAAGLLLLFALNH